MTRNNYLMEDISVHQSLDSRVKVPDGNAIKVKTTFDEGNLNVSDESIQTKHSRNIYQLFLLEVSIVNVNVENCMFMEYSRFHTDHITANFFQ